MIENSMGKLLRKGKVSSETPKHNVAHSFTGDFLHLYGGEGWLLASYVLLHHSIFKLSRALKGQLLHFSESREAKRVGKSHMANHWIRTRLSLSGNVNTMFFLSLHAASLYAASGSKNVHWAIQGKTFSYLMVCWSQFCTDSWESIVLISSWLPFSDFKLIAWN